MSQGTQRTAAVDQIKSEVRQTIEELRALTRASIPFDQFCQTLLTKVVPLTGAHGAIIWQFKGEQGFAPIFGFGPRHQAIPAENQAHQGLLGEVARHQKSLCVASDAISDDPNAANMLLIAVPIHDRQKRIWGSLELLQRGEINEETQQGYLKFTTQLASLFARWQEQHDLLAASSSEENWADRVSFIREIHKSIDLTESAYAIANEARRLLHADRVALAIESGGGYKIKAVSSQDRFDNRGNVVKKLNRLITSSIRSSTPLWLTGDTSNLPPKLAGFVNEYLDESHSRTFGILPLIVAQPKDHDDLNKRKKKRVGRVVGGLVIEFFDQEVVQVNIEQNLSLITEESSVALDNSLATHDVFLLPFWRTLGQLRENLWTNYRGRTIAGAVAFVLLTAILCFYPAPMKLKVDGILQPESRRNLFSKVEAVIKTVHKDQNEQVKAGDLLLTLESKPLEQKRLELTGKIESLTDQIDSLFIQLRKQSSLPQDEKSQVGQMQLSGNIQQLEIERKGLIELAAMIDREMDSLKVFSPIDGTVMNWDARRKLEGLPVVFSQPMLTIADLKGSWQVELLIPQSKCGYIRTAFEKSPDRRLPTDFLLTTDPNTRFKGRLIRISDRTETNENGLTEFRAIVEIDSDNVLRPEAGAGVIARVDCGRQPLGFVWFYQVYDFVRTRVLF